MLLEYWHNIPKIVIRWGDFETKLTLLLKLKPEHLVKHKPNLRKFRFDENEYPTSRVIDVSWLSDL